MTGFAFVFGVAPMVVASGASSKSQQALGTGVMGGMNAVVILALLMVPMFYVVVQSLFGRQSPTGEGHIPAVRTPRRLRTPRLSRALASRARSHGHGRHQVNGGVGVVIFGHPIIAVGAWSADSAAIRAVGLVTSAAGLPSLNVTTCNFPETAAVWCELGHDAGFGEARQVFVDPTYFLRLFRFEGVRRSRHGSAPISNSSGTTGQRCHAASLANVGNSN
jgi:hypothetical protein